MPLNTQSWTQLGQDLARRFGAGGDIADAIRGSLPAFEIEVPGLERIRDLARLSFAFPDNVDAIDFEKWPQLVKVSADSRIGVAWAPRVEILEELLTATTPVDRDRVLLDRQQHVLADCQDALERADHPSVIELAGFTTEAIAAMASFPAAAQALATNALETALNVRERNFPRRHEWFDETFSQPVDDEQTIGVLRLIVSGCGIPPSYKNYELSERETEYSRNGTVHCANTALYSRLNALKAITLATSWLVYESHEG